jgi:3-hydroxyisobutyrate dehydrogenase-like beta-hydroxyacid dehydrogenase
MTKKIGFIGLGMMGKPMAKNLLKAGFEVTVWNRTAAKAVEVVEQGAKSATSVRELAAAVQVIITMVTGSAELEQVVLGAGGVLEGLRPGATLIDMSTVSPATSRAVAAEVAQKGGVMLDAPVSGSVGVATAAALTIQVGGDSAAFEAQSDVFGALGKNIFHVGGNGMGCYMKLVGNALMAINMAALVEALCLGGKAGITTEAMLGVLKTTGGASAVMERRGPNILKGDYTPQFMLKLLFKDLGIALDSAASDSVPMPILGLVRQVYAQALAADRGNQDFSAVAALAQDLAKVSLKTQ